MYSVVCFNNDDDNANLVLDFPSYFVVGWVGEATAILERRSGCNVCKGCMYLSN